jgi:hypothetical protein
MVVRLSSQLLQEAINKIKGLLYRPPWAKSKTLSPKQPEKKDWGISTSSRIPASQI